MAKLTSSAQQQTTGQLPKATYKLRLLKEPIFKPTKTNQPMLVFEAEIKDAPITNNYDPNGTKFTIYCTLEPGKSFQIQALHNALELPAPEDVDIDESTGLPIDITYTGREFFAICETEETKQVGDDGKTVILNPYTGKPVVGYQKKLSRILVRD